MDAKDYYATLGLTPSASQEEAKEAYRELVKQWHPDKLAHNPDLQHIAQEKLKEINAAYEFVKTDHTSSRDESQSPEAKASVDDTPNQKENQTKYDEDRKRQEDKKHRERKAAEESAANQKREQAQREQERQNSERRAEEKQKAEEQESRDKAKQAKVQSRRVFIAIGIIGMASWVIVASIQTKPAQPDVAAYNSTHILSESVNNSHKVVDNTPVEKQLFSVMGDFNSLIGSSKMKIHQTIGPPTFSFSRSRILQEEEVSTRNNSTFTIFQDNKAIQVESTPRTITGPIFYSQIKQQHPKLQISAYSYGWFGHDKLPPSEKEIYNEKAHYQMPSEVYYYDDVNRGIAFAISDQSGDQVEEIIIHKPGMKVIPAMYGNQHKPIGELPTSKTIP